MPLFALLPVLGYAFVLSIPARGRVELALFASISSITLAMYVFALAGWLGPGAAVVFWVGVALCAGMPFVMWRRSRDVAGMWLSPGPAVFVAYAVVHWYLFRDAELFFWDELSHWGLATKELFFSHRLWSAGGNVEFTNYPPGAALWQYFVCRLGGYSEPSALFAQFMMLLAPTLTLYRNASWRWIPVILALQCFLFAGLGHGTSNLYVDHVVAAFFGGIVVAYLSDRETPTWMFAPALLCIVLVKAIGLFLGLAAVVWMAGERVVAGGALRLPADCRRRVGAIVTALVFLSPVAAQWSWSAYTDQNGLRVGGEERGVDVGEMVGAALGGVDQEYQRVTLRRFGEVLARQPVCKTRASGDFNEFSYAIREQYSSGFKLSALGYLVLFLLLVGARARLAEHERRTLWWTAGFLGVVFVAYAAMLLTLYLFDFPQHKAVGLASYVRYIHIILLPLVMVALACYLPACRRFDTTAKRSNVGHAILAAAMVVLLVVETPYLKPLTGQARRQTVRQRVTELVEPVRRNVPAGSRLYVVSLVGENPFIGVLLRYELSPLKATITPGPMQGVMARLPGYDYLWVFAPDDAAATRLGGALASGDRLFRVEERTGRYRLRPVR